MESIKLEDLDNEPISFDLSEEDLQSIKGGSTTINTIPDGKKPFPIKISPYPICISPYPIKISPYPICIYIIKIQAYPIDPIGLDEVKPTNS
ncbi:hypothetical protein SD80_027910 [Scytonema tolypothrichoides VB-61278]|nr:hypothetical protein SD80_027910 [Scytonema tolypothrichoides VB-61278]